jgi:phosphate transport system substrate-binding protein
MALAAVGLSAFSVPPAAGQGTPSVTVRPATELSDLQSVKVDWSGFPGEGTAHVRQCKAGATDVNSQCTGVLSAGFTESDGVSLGAYAQLAFGDLTSPALTGFRCDPDNACEIRVDLQGTSVFATTPLPASIFSKAFAPCPQGPLPLSGSGASEAGGAIEAWIVEVCNPPRSLTVDYSIRSSPNGRREFIQKTADFGVTGSPFSADEINRLRQDGGRDERSIYIPITAGSLVIAYNFWVPDPDNPGFFQQIRDLCLSAETVARLYNGKLVSIREGGRPPTEIMRDNDGQGAGEPNIDFPFGAFVRPVSRADASNATLQMTSWFYSDAAARDAWESGGTQFVTGATEVIPAATNVDGRTGARAVARQVTETTGYHHVEFSRTVPSDFVFGIMDLSTARLLGLPVAKLRTNTSDACVAPTDPNVSAGVGAMKPNDDQVTRSPDFSLHSPNVYPLPNVNYLIASTDGVPSDPSLNDALRGFVDHALGAGQVSATLRGYVPLPADMVAQGRDALARLPGNPGSPAGGLEEAANAGLGNFDSTAPPLSSSTPSTPGGGLTTPGQAAPSVGTGAEAGGGTGSGGGGDGTGDTSGSALTRFLSSDKAIPILLVGLLALSAIFGGPIMRIVAKRREGG